MGTSIKTSMINDIANLVVNKLSAMNKQVPGGTAKMVAPKNPPAPKIKSPDSPKPTTVESSIPAGVEKIDLMRAQGPNGAPMTGMNALMSSLSAPRFV